jgi:hypothetical protein
MLDEFFLTDQQVADLLSITLETLRNKISSGDPLPPYRLPPNSRQRIWVTEDLKKWILDQPCTNTAGVSAKKARVSMKL